MVILIVEFIPSVVKIEQMFLKFKQDNCYISCNLIVSHYN